MVKRTIVISLNSAESEYYGVVKGASVGLGVQAMFRDLGVELKLEILIDASAAKGIAAISKSVICGSKSGSVAEILSLRNIRPVKLRPIY